MPESISHELLRLLAAMKAGGRRVAWLSDANRNLLRNPRAAMRPPAGPPDATMSRTGMTADSSATTAMPTARLAPVMPAAGFTPPPPAANTPPVPAPPAPPSPPAVPASVRFSPASQEPPAAPLAPLAPLDLAATDWTALEGLCAACERCELCRTRHHVVFGQGQRNARLMFIGEGPGHDEDMQGLPFVGAAGQLLTKMIAAMGLDRLSEDPAQGVYIANIVKCRPPHNRNPEQREADACLPYLRRQIELVKPEAIVLLGAVPLQYLLGITGITKTRGQWLNYGDIPVMPTFHPALILRFSNSPQLERENKLKVWDDLQKVMALLKLPLPPPRKQ